MTRHRSRQGWTLLAGLCWLVGCAEANPQPSPGRETGPNGPDPEVFVTPAEAPDTGRVLVTTPTPDSPQVALAGLPGAVPGAGSVVVERATGSAVGTWPATASGSFAGLLPAGSGETLRLAFLPTGGTADERSPFVEVTVPASDEPAGGYHGWPAEQDGTYDKVSTELPSAPDGTGPIQLVGAPGAAPADSSLVAGNVQSGAVVRTTAAADGSFSVAVPGRVGDTLFVFVTAADGAGPTSDVLVIVVAGR